MSHNRESEKETQALLEMEQQESVTEQEEQSEQEDSEQEQSEEDQQEQQEEQSEQEQSEEEQEEQPVEQEEQLQDQKQSEEPSDETQQIPLKQNLQKKYTRKPGKQEVSDPSLAKPIPVVVEYLPRCICFVSMPEKIDINIVHHYYRHY